MLDLTDLAVRRSCVEPFEPRAEEKVVYYVTAGLTGEARAFPAALSGGQGEESDFRF
jgi:hypothetical protein